MLAMLFFASLYACGTNLLPVNGDNTSIRKKALDEILTAKKYLFSSPEKSFSAALQARKFADNLKDVNLQGRSTLLMGISLYRLYRFDEAITHIRKANKFFIQSGNIEGQISVLKYQAVIQSDQGLYKKAFPYFESAISLSKKLNNDTITVDLTILNGYVHVFNSDLKNSFLNFDDAYQLSRKSKKLNLIARSSLALGDWYNADGNFKAAIDFYHKAAIICDSLNDRGGYIWAMNKLGMLFAGWQRYPDALDYLRKALSKSDDNHLLVGSGLTHRNLGDVYINKGEFQEALKNYTAAFKIEQTSGNNPGMAESLCGEAEVLLNDNQFIRVKRLLDSVKLLVKGNFDPSIHAAISRISGLYYLKTENYTKAKVELLNAVKLAKNYDQARLRLSAIHDLKTLSEKEKNYAEAYRYTLKYNALNDSVYNIRLHSQLVEKRMVYRNDEVQQQIESLKTVNLKDMAEVKDHNQIVLKQRLLMITGIFGSIVFFILLILIIRHNYVIKNVNLLLSERNEQLIIQKDNINEALQRAKQSEKLQSVFLANMSHEIRTPMNAIMGFSELLGLDEIDEEESEQFINHIITNSEILLDIMDNIIDIAQLEAGQFALSYAPCRIDELLSELEETFLLRLNTHKNTDKISLELKLPSNFTDLELYTDRMRLYQIISNLLDNALKFTEQGSIEFGIEKREDSFLHFYVKDTGIGIKPENKELIFNRFRQVEDSFTRRFGGVGLGLSISKSLIDLLGGTIWVESVPDQGSIFRFTHPINESMFTKPQFKKNRRIFRDSLIGIQTARAHSYYLRRPL
jgi:signal transduction histidine kinase